MTNSETVTTTPKTPTEEVTLRLFLALTIKDEKISQHMAKEAEQIAITAKLSREEIGKAKMYSRAQWLENKMVDVENDTKVKTHKEKRRLLIIEQEWDEMLLKLSMRKDISND